jgi:hypothetical protein
MPKEEQEITVEELQTFQIGELPNGFLVVALGYATSQEKLSRGEMESFVIAMSRKRAIELGNALLATAKAPPSGAQPTAHH